MGLVHDERRALYMRAFVEEVDRIAQLDGVVTDTDFAWRFRNACAHAQHKLNPKLIAPQLPDYIGVVWSEYERKLSAYARVIWCVVLPDTAPTQHGAA